MHIKNLKRTFFITATVLAGAITSGCDMVYDDLDPCPAQLRIHFKYDYNLKWADALAREVSSVNIWAFDSNGNPVWSGQADGEQLASGDFYMDTPLGEGTYDFVAWGGLKGNEQFDLATYTPASKEDLEVTLKTVEEDSLYISDARLSPLFHANMNGVKYIIDTTRPYEKVVTASLMKDTKDFRVMLQNLDGSEMNNRDFTVTITDDNSKYAWNNSLIPSSVVTYMPWNTRYGSLSTPATNRSGESDMSSRADGAVSTISTLIFELSTGRLMENANAILTIHRNWDDRDIIRIPLIQYLLLVKGHYGDISDQEYLDRQDDYSLMFFLDPDSNWNAGANVFINGWAVVPPQDQDF